MKDYSKLKVGMLIMILVVMVGLVGCDSGTGNDGSAIQDYSVDIIIEDINEDEVDDLKIYAAGETHDGLNDHQENNKVEYTITLTDSADISVAHESEDIAFTPQTQTVDSSDDNISLIFRKGKFAENIEVLGDHVEDENLRAIVLSGDIDFNEVVDQEVFDLAIDRDLIIDGQDKYSIKGDGMMIIEMNKESDPSLTFKNLTFEIGYLPEDWNQENDPDHISKEYIILDGEGGNFNLNNITVVEQKEEIQNFLVVSLFEEGKLSVENSEISLDLTEHIIDINRAESISILGNTFSKGSSFYNIRILNNSQIDLSIKDNDFSQLNDDIMMVWSDFSDSKLIINGYELNPVVDEENNEEVESYRERSLKIHNSLYENNDLEDNYKSSFVYHRDEASIVYTGYISTDIEVEFADDNLEQAVRYQINQPDGPIYKGYIDSITSFGTGIGGIESLEGIEHFESLEELYIFTYENSESNEITDISALVELDNIKVLQLTNNNSLTDISEIAKLNQLERVFMFHNPDIEDFSPLTELDNLYYLNLGNTDLNNEDLNVISEIEGLKELLFWDNKVTDISSLENLRNLERLIYGEVSTENEFHNKVEDISVVEELTELRQLYIPGTNVKDIEPVKELENLNSLNIGNNQIKDFSPLEDLTDLIYLSIYNTGLESLSHFINYTNLNYLNFSDNNVNNLSPLSDIESWNFEPGDPEVNMINNPFNLEDEQNVIDELKSKGINVEY